jgi:hypothetical protein
MTQKDLVNKTFHDNFDLIKERVDASKFPNTFKFLFRSDQKIELFSNVLRETVKQKNFYASQAITRIVLEHFIVAYYVWTKARIDESDECATEYYSFYGLQEQIKQENYNSKLDKSYDNTKSALQNVAAKDPEVFGDTTEADILDLNIRANKFDIRRILAFLTDELDVNDAFKSLHVIVLNFCKRYNYLSSYIHGGPTAEFQAFENMPKTDHEKITNDNAEYAETMNYQLKSLLMLLLVADDKKNIDIYQPVYDFLEKNAPK